MKRRDFLKAATGAAGGAAVSGVASPVAAQETTEAPTTQSSGNGTQTAGGATTQAGGGGGGGGGGTKTVAVGPGGNYVFTPGTEEPLVIAPGTTVKFVWESDNHNVVPESQPEGANWSGHEPIENTGFSFSSTFETLGTYEYFCQPHKALGMVGTIEVKEGGAQAAASAARTEPEPEEMGVPIQAHFVGIATILMLVVSFIYTFFFLKYGESAHSSSPNR